MSNVFILQNWARASAAYNTGIDSEGVNGPSIFTYQNVAGSTGAQIAAANYFAQVVYDLAIGDIIFANGSDAFVGLQVNALNQAAGTVTTVSLGLTTSIGTADIQNNAVTYAKFQAVAASSLLGNATGSSANAEEITLVSPLAFTGTTLEVLPAVLNYKTGTITSAQWKAIYSAPLVILASTVAGAGKIIVIDKFILNYTYVSAAYAAGGSTLLQYGNTVHGAGVAACTALAAAGFSDQTASMVTALPGALAANAATLANTGIYLSAATADFTTGDGTFTYYLTYKVVAIS